MLPFEKLVELFQISIEPWVSVGNEAALVGLPTNASVKRIEKELNIHVPEDYVRLAKACGLYTVALASIGEDYQSSDHILSLNRDFHGEISQDLFGAMLPPYLVIINHGHDGDCDCWDTREVTSVGEHPIIYFPLEGDRPGLAKRFESLRSYIEYCAVTGAVRSPNKRSRRKAKQIIDELGLGEMP